MADDDLIALVDMDGTLADLQTAMEAALRELASPEELRYGSWISNDPHIEARRRLIKRQPGFWRDLVPIQDGFDVLTQCRRVGFECHLLTRGPRRTHSAWMEKAEWAAKHLPGTPITITWDKSGQYGRVLVDDWPLYILGWLKWRPRGQVVMLDQPWNGDFEHPNVFRYLRGLEGEPWRKQARRLDELLVAAHDRVGGEPVALESVP